MWRGFCSSRAEVEQRGGEDRQRRHVEAPRHVVADGLLGECPLILDAQPEPAVLGRESRCRRTRRRTASLQSRARVAAASGLRRSKPLSARGMLSLQPRARPQPKLVDGLWRGEVMPRPRIIVAMRSRDRSGVPYIARLTVARRRYRWMSCSHVTPMPPWSCTQSCNISVASDPMKLLAAHTISPALEASSAIARAAALATP